MTIRIANYWADFISSRWNNAEPTDDWIAEMKDIGFNRILFSEITYNRMRQDLIDAQNGILPNVKNTIDKIHAQGMTVTSKLANTRYGGRDTFYQNNPVSETSRNEMLSAAKYLASLGVDQIDLEEPFTSSDYKEIQAQFFIDIKNKIIQGRTESGIPGNTLMSFNIASTNITTLTNGGFPFDNQESKNSFDIVMTSPNLEDNPMPPPPYYIPNSTMLSVRNDWKAIMPHCIIIDGIFISAAKRIDGVDYTFYNPEAVENIRQAVNDNVGVAVWPALNMDKVYPNQKRDIKEIFSIYSCPQPQFEFQITQIQTQ